MLCVFQSSCHLTAPPPSAVCGAHTVETTSCCVCVQSAAVRPPSLIVHAWSQRPLQSSTVQPANVNSATPSCSASSTPGL